MSFKLGRNPREHDPNVPHLSAILGGNTPLPPPPAVDYTQNMPQAPSGFGMMLNNVLSDCTCAAYYHARQIWTFHSTGETQTVPDQIVELLYEKACGYNAAQGGEGPGGCEQRVLKYLHKIGAPVEAEGSRTDKILGFVEVDPRNLDDVKRTILNAGVAYVGFNVPANIVPANGKPPALWTVAAGKAAIAGSHAGVLPGYDATGALIISWGQLFKMTWEFFSTYVDEVYCIGDAAWSRSDFAKTRKLTLPGGLSESELAHHMRFL